MKQNKKITRDEINQYFSDISLKIKDYVSYTKDEELLFTPDNCEYTRFTLILSQFRHLHSHMGMIMGFIIEDTGMWPRVLGLESYFIDLLFCNKKEHLHQIV